MIIISVNSKATMFCVAACLLMEILRIGLAYLVAKPSNQMLKLEEEKFQTNVELAAIKSIQADLVKHSKLTRKIIKLEKEIEKLQLEIAPRHKKVKNLFRTIRICAYVAFIAYMWETQLAVFSPKMLWPFNIVTSASTCNLPVPVFIFFLAFACRHVLRTILNIVCRNVDLP